ncbi:hypothetical protein R1flu_006295 [Riccia fluitans]|uniref:Uncharacterized protein n=1 Tax=Riccia fluitans TaxID=41844 RepID=A0ABD1YVM2_9MARC
MESGLHVDINCVACQPVVHRGHARVVRILNGGSLGEARVTTGVIEIEYPVENATRIISSTGENAVVPPESGTKRGDNVIMAGRKQPRHCGVCKALGHNKRTYQNRPGAPAMTAAIADVFPPIAL